MPLYAAEIPAVAPEPPAIYTAEPLPAPAVASPSAQETIQQAPVPGQPLRVVIPNIAQEKKPATKEISVHNAAAPAAPATAATSQGTAAKNKATALQKVTESVASKAEEIWQNGVMLADWTNTVIIRAMVRPNIAFAAVPQNWQVAAADQQEKASVALNTDAIAALAPAAGSAETINSNPQQNPAAVVPTPIIPSPPAVAAANTPQPDASEPAPSLSSQSKAIAEKIPQVADKPAEKGLAKKVDLEHVTTTATPINTNTPPKANDALGVKVNMPKAQVDVNYELERAYNQLIAGRSEVAIQIYEDILTGSPKNKDALFGLASTYHRLGQIDMARSIYGKLLALDPKHRDGLNNFLVLLADEAPQEALSQMERLEQQNPSFSPIPAQMAIIYQKLGDKDKAVEKMYRALAIAPENITYRYNLAIMLDKNGNYAEAGKLYSQLLDSHAKGEVIPGDATKIQQRLTFISSNSAR